MKVTEKVYIERLEGMMKRYKNNPCDHCPMMRHYNPKEFYIYDVDEEEKRDLTNAGCVICLNLTEKYNNIDTKDEDGRRSYCPCKYYAWEIFLNEEMPDDYMTKVAYNVIRGWKKEHKGE